MTETREGTTSDNPGSSETGAANEMPQFLFHARERAGNEANVLILAATKDKAFGRLEAAGFTNIRLFGQLSDDLPRPGPVSGFFLLVGQAVSVLYCMAVPVLVVWQLGQVGYVEQLAGSPLPLQRFWIVAAGIVSFCLAAAMFLVFSRIRWLPNWVQEQTIGVIRIWRELDELRQRAVRETKGPNQAVADGDDECQAPAT